MSLHNKVISFSDIRNYKKELSRRFYLNKDTTKRINEKIKNKFNLLFMPISIYDNVTLQNEKYKKYLYKIIIFGILEDGRRCSVVLNDIYPFIEIKVPINSDQVEFAENILNALDVDKDQYVKITGDKVKYFGIEAIDNFTFSKGKYFKEFQENQDTYVKISFGKTQDRSYAIKYLRKLYPDIQIVHDDMNNYYRVVCRDYLISFNSWCVISKYDFVDKHDRIDGIVFNVSIHNYKIYDTSINAAILSPEQLKKDQTLSMCWDIETYKTYDSGDKEPPIPENREHILFMIGVTFQWYHASEQLLRICFICMPSNEYEQLLHDNYLTIICNTEADLIKAFIKVWSWMLPDIILGFNDSMYDWPWLKLRSQQLGILKDMAKSICQIMPNDFGGNPWTDTKISTNYYRPIQYNLDQDTKISSYKLSFPGYVAIDVRIIFRQLYPNDESSSLNHYLTRLGIQTKLDINFKDMFDMYEEIQKLRCQDKPIPERLIKLMQQVAHYCVVDAQRCHELMHKLYVIMDKRTISHMSYVSFQDAIERANGMKVRNLIIANGQQAPFCLKFSNNAVALRGDKQKYPGAYVFPPRKGVICSKLSISERKIAQSNEWKAGSGVVARAYKVIDEHGAYIPEKQLVQIENDSGRFPDCVREFFTEEIQRPITSLDYSSLYPSLMMTYNLSTEYIILNEAAAEELSQRHTLFPVEFQFGGDKVGGWIVRHDNKTDASQPDFKFGIFGYVLKQLFDKRKIIKGQMAKYAAIIKDPTQDNLHADAIFQYEYLNSTQKALKIFMNTFYGEIGNQLSPFFMVQIAGAITINGSRCIKLVEKFVKEKECQVYYGDSVTADEPVILQDEEGRTIIRAICDIINDNWLAYPQFKSDCPDLIEKQQASTNYKIWTNNGWQEIIRIIRHKTNKKMYRINTYLGRVDVTADHSLLTKNLQIVKPSECKIGDELCHSFPIEFYSEYSNITYDEFWLYGVFFANGDIAADWQIKELTKIVADECRCILKKSGDVVVLQCNEKYSIKTQCDKIIVKFQELFYTKLAHKKIPDSVINAEYDERMSFIMGYLDAIHCMDDIANNHMSKIGAQGLFYLAKSLRNIDIDIDESIKLCISHVKRTGTSIDNQFAIKKITELPTTTEFVYDIETKCGKFNAGIGCLTLKNTDSLHSSMPNIHFVDIDKKYYTDKITKQEYWNALVEITFKVVENIRNEINEMLYQDNGTRFLNMAFEEALFPAIYSAKKKYVGIAHEHEPSFLKPLNIPELRIQLHKKITAKFPEYNADNVRNVIDDEIIAIRKKRHFLRGLDIVRRGMPNFAKEIILDILEDTLSIGNTCSLFDIVKNKIREIYQYDWSSPNQFYKFIMTDQFKPHKNNEKVHVFVQRMAKDYNVIIKPFERFEYIIARKYPYKYDVCGRKQILKGGEKMELANIAFENGIPIDIDCYMKSKLNGQLARLITYHPQFAVGIEGIDMNADDGLSRAEFVIYGNAVKWIETYSANFNSKYISTGDIYKNISKNISTIAHKKISDITQLRIDKKLLVPKSFKEIEKLSDWIIKKSESMAKLRIKNYGEKYIAVFVADYTAANNLTKESLQKNKFGKPIYKSVKEYVLYKLFTIYFGKGKQYNSSGVLTLAERVYEINNERLQEQLFSSINELHDLLYKYSNTISSAMDYVATQNNIADLHQQNANEEDVQKKLETVIDFISNNESALTDHISQILNDQFKCSSDELVNCITKYESIFDNMIHNNIFILKIRSIAKLLQKNKNESIGDYGTANIDIEKIVDELCNDEG